jgi:hypothetical protein
MGYSTILDIIGSVIAGGVLMIILLNTNTNAVQNTYTYGGDIGVQGLLTVLANVLDSDFRKIGYSSNGSIVVNSSNVIISADTSSIKFLSDINNHGQVDTVYYYLGPTSELSNTSNPIDRFLYRIAPDTGLTNVTHKYPDVVIFRFAYYDSSGNSISCPVASPSKISKINISLELQSPQAYNGVYVTTYWNSTKRIAVNVMNR